MAFTSNKPFSTEYNTAGIRILELQYLHAYPPEIAIVAGEVRFWANNAGFSLKKIEEFRKYRQPVTVRWE